MPKVKKTIMFQATNATNSIPIEAEIEIEINPEDLGLPRFQDLADGKYNLVVTEGTARWVEVDATE